MGSTELLSRCEVVLLSFCGGDIHHSCVVHEDSLRVLVVVKAAEFLGRVHDTIVLALQTFSQFEKDDGTFFNQRVDNKSAPDHNEYGAE